MSDSPTFSSSECESQTSAPEASLHTCQPCGTSCQRMAESRVWSCLGRFYFNLKQVQPSCGRLTCIQTTEERDVGLTQQDINAFSFRAAGGRRHSTDGAIGSALARGPVDSARFHPYRRQFSDGAVLAAGCVQQRSPTFSCLPRVCSPDTRSYTSSSKASPPWDQYNSSVHQNSYPELPAAPVEPSCFLSQSYPSCSSLGPLQVSSQLFSNNGQTTSSKYPTPAHQENTQCLFPKPIYSYSILIFMALKNSKTGSLPVSEIYSFMTEHFPYFKTAPDGWKNSVRHNLSLNKCFEKVENKNGNSSRKGCLWALNPAKVEKMQEELHKWRRKDPITVRRSMARPEDLDRLLGERPDKMRSLPPYTNPALLSRVAPLYTTASPSCAPPQLRPPCHPIRRPLYAHVQAQHPSFLPPVAAHPRDSFALYSPCAQQPAAGVPPATGSQSSPVAGKMPPVYGAPQPECSVGPKSMQDLLLDGDSSYDVDTLNPSLTDLQLQGHLWEEIREDSLLSDPHVTTTTPSGALQDALIQGSCLHGRPPQSQPSEGSSGGACKVGFGLEDTDSGQHLGQHGCLNGLHPVVYSGVEGLATYLTSCTTSISLM